MKHSTIAKKGLTLIEVLIAMIILSIGVSAIMLSMARCLSVVRTARNLEIARSLVGKVDIEFPITRENIEEISESGEFEDFPGYTWFRKIIAVDEEEQPGLFLVTVRIQWSSRGRDTFEEITTYKYAPDAESVTRKI
ncbi:MAG TPA: prepilin-type N-terminal cleavage/methylation domain-containing protein [Pontiella sp.]